MKIKKPQEPIYTLVKIYWSLSPRRTRVEVKAIGTKEEMTTLKKQFLGRNYYSKWEVKVLLVKSVVDSS